MSWSIEVCGTRETVKAAIDEKVSQTGGMPAPVGDYLKAAVDAIDLATTSASPDLVYVKSSGHRPMYCLGQEESIVRRLPSGPQK